MNWDIVFEIIGYVASAIVLVSFFMSSIVKLRWISATGSLIFAVYALLIKSYPTAFMNFSIVAINLYYLIRMLKKVEIFTALPTDLKSRYLRRYIMFYGSDIQRYFPDFALEETGADLALFVHCDMTTACLFIGKNEGNGILRADLDYTTPAYRDMRVAKYLYAYLKQEGYTKFLVSHATPVHVAYLMRMGFVKEGAGFVKEIK